jgi:5'-3' exonuclease
MNVLIIDTSYYNFYRFFATSQWYKRAYPDEVFESEYNWAANIVFWEKFKKMFMSTLAKIIKNCKAEKVLFARDCPRKDIWRVPLFPNYKGDREENYKKNNFQGGPVFKKCYTDIIDPLIDNQQFYQIKIDRLEADDIIALSCKHILINHPDTNITIISSDHDLLQLITPQITLMDAKMNSYNNKSAGSKELDIFLKCITGDASDCIPKVFDKVGPKTALKLYHNPDQLAKKFKENPDSLDQFALNNILVSFDNIPDKLQQTFVTVSQSFCQLGGAVTLKKPAPVVSPNLKGPSKLTILREVRPGKEELCHSGWWWRIPNGIHIVREGDYITVDGNQFELKIPSTKGGSKIDTNYAIYLDKDGLGKNVTIKSAANVIILAQGKHDLVMLEGEYARLNKPPDELS